MKKFGFGSKGDADEDAARAGLFGKKKSNGGGDNPYAAQDPASDPYANANMTPYQQARVGLPTGPRPGAGGGPGGGGLPSGPGPRGSTGGRGGGLPSGPGPRSSSGGPPPPYSSQPPTPQLPPPQRQQQQPVGGGGGGGGYGNDRLGNPAGYGSNRYAGNGGGPGPAAAPPRAGARGPGGYGGLGDGPDSNRDALFGGAGDRFASQPPQQQRRFDDAGGSYGQSGPSADSGGESYGGYGERRELTEEERAAQDLQDTSQQIRQYRDETLSSGMRSLQLIEQSEETVRGTLARLGAQGERLHNTEANLDRAAIHNRVAEERTKELKTLNRSMFAVHVGNPFTSKQKAAAREQEVLERHRQERDTRDATRRDAFASTQRMEDTFREAERSGWRAGGDDSGDEAKAAAASSKFTFVDDDDDDGEKAAEDARKEREIRETEKAMLRGVKKLNYLAHAVGREVDQQNGLIDRIAKKSDVVDDGVRMNREKLNRF